MSKQRFASVWDAIEDTPEEAENMRLRSILMMALKNHLTGTGMSQAQAEDAVRVLLEETPQELDLDEVREHLEQVPHVVAVHDLHASTVSTGMPVVMAHVVVERGLTMDDAADILSQLQNCLREHFPVSVPHTTFQLEPEGYDSDSRKELHS